MDGAKTEGEPINATVGTLNVSKYDATRGLVVLLRDRQNLLSSSRVGDILRGIQENSSILGESFGHDQYVLPTLQTIRELQSVSYNDRLPNDEVSEIRKLGHTLLLGNLSNIDQAIQRLADPASLQLAMELVDEAITHREDHGEEPPPEGIDFLIRHFEDGLRTDDTEFDERDPYYTKYSFIALGMFRGMNAAQRGQAIQMLQHAVDDSDIRARALYVVSHLTGDVMIPDEVQAEIRTNLVKPIIEKFGLDYDKLLKAWVTGSDEVSGTYFYTNYNLKEVFSLEEAHPGICRTLMDEFGISNFLRYPRELLIDMYEQRDNSNIPYGLMLYPKRDHSGAFYEAREVIDKFYQQLKVLGYGLRLYEAGSKYELARVFIGSKRRYGVDNKVAFVILAGHGNPTAITFGETQKGDEGNIEINEQNAKSLLSQADFESKGVQRVGELLADGANIILLSCSTGAKEGIAKTISDTYPKTLVTAPEVPTDLKNLDVTKDDQGKLHFRVLYGSDVAKSFAGGETT